LRSFQLDKTARLVAVGATVCVLMCSAVESSRATERCEILRYEVTWNGSKAGHGDITTRSDARSVNVICQAVSDGVLKAIIEIWSRVQATFSANSFKPQAYQFHLKSSLSHPELVDLSFDHKNQLVQVSKQKGSERECHSEKFTGTYDPVSAIYLLRNQKDLTKPMFVDIYDGKDRSRLLVNFAGMEPVKVRTGVHSAVCLDLKLVKLSGGDKGEIGTGKLWISNDAHRIPLLLTSSPLVGTVRFELVEAQL
jgi:hypothetical protein